MSFGTRYKAGLAVLAGMAAAMGAPSTAMNAVDMGVFLPTASRGQRKAQKAGDRKGLRRRANRDHAKQRAKLKG